MRKLIWATLLFVLIPSASAQQYLWRYRSASDCTAITDGKITDLCYQTADQKLYKCVPSAGDCNTASEWKLATGSADTMIASGINWVDFYNIPGEGINWTNDYIQRGEVNWTLIQDIQSAGVNWLDIQNQEIYLTGLNWTDGYVPDLSVNWEIQVPLNEDDPVWTSEKSSYATLVSPNFTTPNIGTATGSVSGNAGTATALAANGSNCNAGNFPLGVDASGAVESCTAVPTAASLSVDDLITLSGIAEGSTNFGEFTGTTIPDNQTAKAALQAIETAVEAAGGDVNWLEMPVVDAEGINWIDIRNQQEWANGINWIDYDATITNQPNSVNWIDLTPIFAAVQSPAGASHTQSLTVGDVNQFSVTQFGSVDAINWVNFPVAPTGAINWVSVENGEVGNAGINWLDIVGQQMQSGGINWTDLNSPPGEHRAGFAEIGLDADSDVDLGAFPYDITIDSPIYFLAYGSTVTGGWWECDANGANCLTIADDSTAQDGTTLSDTGIGNPGITAGNVIKWITTSVGGTVTRFSSWFFYHYNAVK